MQIIRFSKKPSVAEILSKCPASAGKPVSIGELDNGEFVVIVSEDEVKGDEQRALVSTQR